MSKPAPQAFLFWKSPTNEISFDVANGTALQISNGNSTVTSQKLVVDKAISGFSSTKGDITINAKDSIYLNVTDIGIKAYDSNAKIQANTDELTIIVNSTKTYGARAGLYAYQDFATIDAEADVVDINVSGAKTHGVYAQQSGQILIDTTDLDITSNGTEASGVLVGNTSAIANDKALVSINYNTETPVANTIDITSDYRAVVVNNGGTLKMGNKESKIKITASGKQGDAFGLALFEDGSKADIVADTIQINATHDTDARGIHVASNNLNETTARLDINANQLIINVVSEKGDSTGIMAASEGEVYIKANTSITATDAIVTRGDSTVQINQDGKHSTKLEGNIVFDYDNASGSGIDAVVDVTLSGSDSYWKGNAMIRWTGLQNANAKASDASDPLKVTGMKLTVQNGAEWIPTAVESTDAEAENGQRALALNSLMLDKGVVKVDSKVEVNVEKMSGTGTVKLATDLTAEEGAQAGTFKVGSAAEDSALTVKLTNADMTKDLTADDVTPEQAQKLIGNVEAADADKTMVVDEGMYNGAFDVTEEGSTISHGPNSVMQSTLELAAAAPLALNRILTNDVHKRMGDIRSMKETSGAWVRYDGGKLSAESGLDNDFHTIQVGVDTVPAADAPRFGLAFSYTKSDADYSRGEADMDAYSLAAYGLWMGDAGQFVDVVARLATAKTDMTVDGNKKGSMDNVVTALSGEFGWRFDFAKSFYVEPQVELAYTHVDADSLSLSDGSTYRFDDADSLMGRAGFALGLQCPENGNTAYLRVSAVHEFLGDAAVTGGNGTVYEIDGKDTWVEYGLGANFNITNTTYVWADVERTSGGVLDEDYRATIGVRHAF